MNISPELANLGSFTVAVLIMTATPGVATALVLRSAASGGRRAAFATSLGLACALGIWGVIASAGLGAFLLSCPGAFLWMRRAGALYLACLGLRIIWGAFAPKADGGGGDKGAADARQSFGAVFLGGFMVMMLTPEIGVFDATFFPQFLGGHDDIFRRGLVFTVIMVGLALIWQTILGFAVTLRFWNTPSVMKWADRISGVVLILLALWNWK